MLPTLDSSGLPVVVVDFPPNEVSADELDAHFAEVEALVAASATPIAIVVDLRRAELLSLELRRFVAKRMRTGYPLVAGRVLGVAHVVASSLTLGAMNAVWWLASPPFPTLVTRSFDEAMDWARRRVAPSA